VTAEGDAHGGWLAASAIGRTVVILSEAKDLCEWEESFEKVPIQRDPSLRSG